MSLYRHARLASALLFAPFLASVSLSAPSIEGVANSIVVDSVEAVTTHLQSATPAARAGHAMVAPASGGVLLYGGQITDSAASVNDVLWEWNGSTWKRLPAGPANRTLPAAAYDTDRNALVVFGGVGVASNTRYDDTWEYRDGAWSKANAQGPSARDHHAMTYDAARKRVVMFGGAAGETFLNDTWLYDGRAWTKLDVPGPPALVHHAMTYDAKRGKVVLFGGFDKSNVATGLWEFDGARWEQVASSGPAPEPRSRHRLAYDARRGEIVMHGGTNGTETWTWNGTRWLRHDTPGPSARVVSAMAYDVSREKVVLFGGASRDGKGVPPYNYMADTWEWDGTRWHEIGVPSLRPAPALPSAPRPLYSMAADFDITRGRLVVFGGYGRGGYSGETWEWDGAAWSQIAAQGPAPRNSPAMVFDSRRNVMVLFGGDTREQVFGDTWEYNGHTWKKVSDTGPEPRSTHRLAYDSRRGRVVLFGGFRRDAGGRMSALGDTWEWDGASWTRVATTGPAARSLQAMAYDASIGKVVLFGGGLMTAAPPPPSDTKGDTWEWDGARWTEVVGGSPAPRDHVAMGYDAAGRRLVLFGGSGATHERLGDFWQRKGSVWESMQSTGMPPRAGHHVIYDSRERRMLVFGGFGPSSAESPGGPTVDIWAQSGNGWRLLAPSR